MFIPPFNPAQIHFGKWTGPDDLPKELRIHHTRTTHTPPPSHSRPLLSEADEFELMRLQGNVTLAETRREQGLHIEILKGFCTKHKIPLVIQH